MRSSRLLAGQLALLMFDYGDPIGRLSENQKAMNVERKRIAALPADTSSPSRQTKRRAALLAAKRERAFVRKMAGSKRSLVPADWRAFADRGGIRARFPA